MMKSGYLFAGLLLFSALGCKGQPESGKIDKAMLAEKSTSELTETSLAATGNTTISIGKADFLKLVMDYEKNPETWVYQGEMPCIVDFYADWCAPCRITSPILEELALEYAGKVNFYKVNVDKERELASVFGVQSIPTFLFCPMEGNPTISSGIANTPEATKQMFRDQIQQILLKNPGSAAL
jgi:thioredoxin